MTRSANRAMLMLFVILGVIVVATGTAWLADADPMSPGNVTGTLNDVIGPWRTAMMLVRWTLWGTLWWHWERVGQAVFKGETKIRNAQRRYWSGMRSRMIGGIATIEILILLSHFVGT